MDPNATRPIAPAVVTYLCICGHESQFDSTIGGQCPRCEKIVSPKLLTDDLGMTVTIHDGSFEIVPTPDQPAAISEGLASQNQTAVQFHPNDSSTLSDQSDSSSDVEDPKLLIGQQFGHFEIIAPIGRGGMAQVYRALDTSLQRYVAVKVLRSGISSSTSGSQRLSKSSHQEIDKLLQEAVSQARVSHPNIVTIYYVGKRDSDPFLAMELVNGKPLSGRISDGNMTFAEISSVAIQIAEALKFSYELDVIHGDLKPSNMLLQNDGVAKLSDFGMARRVSGHNDKSIGGTPNYIAPELLKGKKPSLESDIYALGVTLYEMSFGQLPIQLTGKNVADWVAIHDQTTWTFPNVWPDHLPETWQHLLTKMLAKNPEDRFSSYDALIENLKRQTTGSQVLARLAPRFVAAGVDWISVLIFAIILQLALGYTNPSPWVTNMLRIADFLPIVIYTIAIYFWRHSIGRSLMHIRVVNRHGLKPTSYRMAMRSLVRMQFPWCFICLSLFDDPTRSWIGIATGVLVIISGILLLLDVAFLAIYAKHQSLHDLLFGTKVVLDTQI
jgi:serine/threonine protein kinase